jgi:hypothetical protein
MWGQSTGVVGGQGLVYRVPLVGTERPGPREGRS